MPQQCYLCQSSSLREFGSLGAHWSVTTDGQFIQLPLLKTQCTDCGLVQTAQKIDDIFAHLSYQDNYAFYDRPNMRVFDAQLYRQYAQWVSECLPDQPRNLRVLEVGCGAAWVLQNLRTIRRDIHVQGVEPSASASRAANQAGIEVIQAAAEDPHLNEMHGRFDFVYSIDVIEHTADPVGFVRAMAKFASPDGTVCVICPSGDVVNLELIFLDHLYSIREANLRHIFQLAGLKPIDRGGAPPTMTAWQRLSGKLSDDAAPVGAYGCPATLLDQRERLFHQWRMIDRRLASRLREHSEVLCFGAGETCDLLRTLAPITWEKIAGHVVDPVEQALRKETYRDKPLYYLDDPRLERFDAVLLGVKPHYQNMLYPRLNERFATVVRWDDLVDDRVEVLQ